MKNFDPGHGRKCCWRSQRSRLCRPLSGAPRETGGQRGFTASRGKRSPAASETKTLASAGAAASIQELQGELRLLTQEALHYGFGIPRLYGHLNHSPKPILRRLLPMPPHNVAVRLDLGRPLPGKPPFHICPGQENGDPIISLHRLVGPNPKVGQSHLGLQVEVDGLAGPAPGVSLQGLLRRAGAIRTADVRRGFLPGMPLAHVDRTQISAGFARRF